VYEYAKQLNMSSKEILTILTRLDVPVANHMSVMDDHMVTKVEKFFTDVKQRAAQRHATEVERDVRERQRQRERAARQAEIEQEKLEQSARNTDNREGLGVISTRRISENERVAEVSAKNVSNQTEAPSENHSAAPQQSESIAPLATSPNKVNQEATNSTLADSSRENTTPSETAPTSGQIARPADSRPVRTDNRSEQRPGSDRTNQSGNSGDRRPNSGYNRTGGGQTASSNTNRSTSENRDNRNSSSDSARPYNNSSTGGNRSTGTSGGYSGNRTGTGTGGNNYGGNRTASTGGGGNYSGNRSGSTGGTGSGGSYGGNRDGNRSSGASGSTSGGSSSGNRGGSGGGNFAGNRSSGGGNFGGNRSGGTSSAARPGGASSGGFGANRPGGGSGSRPAAVGGGFGNRGGSSTASSASNKTSAAGKGKEREKTRGDFQRDRKEQFNENKLSRSGGRRRTGSSGPRTEIRRPEPPSKVIVDGGMSVGDFAKLLRREATELIKKLLLMGIMATINQEIDTDAMELIASEYGTELTVREPVDEEAVDMLIEEEKSDELVSRPPVVTIMGHVDHGKTTLLDAIRESKVTASESGGITQHIGAYQANVNGRVITFLDTPGHEAFTTMRMRGAQVTDITILVVAADDGVMPQTIEAINHAKAANVPIIVAVNKMDKPGANPDKVKQELTVHGLVSEEWGGETIFVNISALKQEGLDALLEMVLLVADVAELKANPQGRPRGTVIEAELDKGRGAVATVLVQNGTLKVGDVVVAGQAYGRIRAMVNDHGKRIKEAGPSMPVEIQGLGDVPSAGDLFVVYDDERAARYLVEKRMSRDKVEQMQSNSRVTLDDLYKQIKDGNVKDLNVIVKADVQGSVEALVQSIEKIEVEGVRVKVLHKGAGAITESDVALASASNAIILGFHVRPDVNAKRAADETKVDIRQYRVIYQVIDELESAMKGMLDPEYKEVVLGHAEVRQVFHISKIGTVAGCYVIDGKMARDAETRVIRDGVVVHEGNLDTLKRFKDDAREVATGYECGITLERFNDLKVGDVIEAFKMEAVKVH